MGILPPQADLKNPDLTDFVIRVDAKRYIEYFHQEIMQHIENHLEDTWRVVAIEQRSETLREAAPLTQGDHNPVYIMNKVLGTFDIVAVENGPLARIVDGGPVAIPRRKLRLKAELRGSDDGMLKIVESDVDAPKRSYL
jgi:hypothetical protein